MLFYVELNWKFRISLSSKSTHFYLSLSRLFNTTHKSIKRESYQKQHAQTKRERERFEEAKHHHHHQHGLAQASGVVGEKRVGIWRRRRRGRRRRGRWISRLRRRFFLSTAKRQQVVVVVVFEEKRATTKSAIPGVAIRAESNHRGIYRWRPRFVLVLREFERKRRGRRRARVSSGRRRDGGKRTESEGEERDVLSDQGERWERGDVSEEFVTR
jgi:hypothetical protein